MPTYDAFQEINCSNNYLTMMDTHSQVECLCLLSSCEDDLGAGQSRTLLPFSALCLSTASHTLNDNHNIGTSQEQGVSLPKCYQELPCAGDRKLNAPLLSNYASNLYTTDSTMGEDNISREMKLPSSAAFSSQILNYSNTVSGDGFSNQCRDNTRCEEESGTIDCEFSNVSPVHLWDTHLADVNSMQGEIKTCDTELQNVSTYEWHMSNCRRAEFTTKQEDKKSYELRLQNDSSFPMECSNLKCNDTNITKHHDLKDNSTYSPEDMHSNILLHSEATCSSQMDILSSEMELQHDCSTSAESITHELNFEIAHESEIHTGSKPNVKDKCIISDDLYSNNSPLTSNERNITGCELKLQNADSTLYESLTHNSHAELTSKQKDTTTIEMESRSNYSFSTADFWIQNQSLTENTSHSDHTVQDDISSLLAVALRPDTSGACIENQSPRHMYKNTFNTAHKLTRFTDNHDDTHVCALHGFTHNTGGINLQQNEPDYFKTLKMISKNDTTEKYNDLDIILQHIGKQENCMSALDNNSGSIANVSGSDMGKQCVGCRRPKCRNIVAPLGNLCLERCSSKEKRYEETPIALTTDRASFTTSPHAVDGYVWVENTDSVINHTCLNCGAISCGDDIVSNPDKANSDCSCINEELNAGSVSHSPKANTDYSCIKDQQLSKEKAIDYTIKSSQISQQQDSDTINRSPPLEKSINNKLHATSVMNRGRAVKSATHNASCMGDRSRKGAPAAVCDIQTSNNSSAATVSHPSDCLQPLLLHTGSELAAGKSTDSACIDTSVLKEKDQRVVSGMICTCTHCDVQAHTCISCQYENGSIDENAENVTNYDCTTSGVRACVYYTPETEATSAPRSSHECALFQQYRALSRETNQSTSPARHEIDCETMSSLLINNGSVTQRHVTPDISDNSSIHASSSDFAATGTRHMGLDRAGCESKNFLPITSDDSNSRGLMSSNVPDDSQICTDVSCIAATGHNLHTIGSGNDISKSHDSASNQRDRSSKSRDVSANPRDMHSESCDSENIPFVGQLEDRSNHSAIYHSHIESDKTNWQSQRENENKECNSPICATNARAIANSHELKEDAALNCNVGPVSTLQYKGDALKCDIATVSTLEIKGKGGERPLLALQSPVNAVDAAEQVRPIGFVKSREEYTRDKLGCRSTGDLQVLQENFQFQIQVVSAELVRLLEERHVLRDQVDMRNIAINQLILSSPPCQDYSVDIPSTQSESEHCLNHAIDISPEHNVSQYCSCSSRGYAHECTCDKSLSLMHDGKSHALMHDGKEITGYCTQRQSSITSNHCDYDSIDVLHTTKRCSSEEPKGMRTYPKSYRNSFHSVPSLQSIAVPSSLNILSKSKRNINRSLRTSHKIEKFVSDYMISYKSKSYEEKQHQAKKRLSLRDFPSFIEDESFVQH